MKKIKNQLMINPFDGRPIQVTYDYQKDDAGKPKLDGLGNPMPMQKDMTVALGIRTFLSNGIDPKETTLDDGYTAIKILDVLRPFKLLEQALCFEQPKHIVLEDAEYDWLLKKMKDRGPKLWGIIAPVYVRGVEDIEKVERPRDDDDEVDHGLNGGAKSKLVKSGKP